MDDIATFVQEALPMCSTPATLQPIMDILKDIGVETPDDMQLVQINDLAGVLRPIQARKLIAHVKSVFSAQSDAASSMEQDFTRTPQTQETLWVTTGPNIPCTSRSSFGSPGTPQTPETPFRTSFGSRISSPSGSECSSPTRQLGSDWHYNFQVPWNMLPAIVRKKLHNQERPTARERREVIRIITAEILATCKTPAKKHLSEVARKMVLEYPESFKDVIEGEVVGSGYDSLTKQLQCRVDNYKRNEALGKKRIIPDDTSTVPENKKQRKAFRTSFGSRISSSSGSECSSPTRQLGSDWHYNFQVPWNMLPAILRKKLHNQEWPTARERREVIRIITAEILATCKTPAKKDLSEVARKKVLEYPESFKDVIEGEVVGSGYHSLTKQLQCRVDNYKRNEALGKKRIIPDDTSTVPENKKQWKDSYGCIQWESGPVNVEAQMKKKKDMQKIFLENERNEKQIEQLISDTFISQRNDIISGKDTQALTEEWPLLFSLVGMKAHFKLLTGVHINEGFEEAMASKLARVLEYFQSLPLEKSSVAAKQRAEIQAGGGPSGAVLMLLSHFKEDRARMFHMVDRTCIAVEVKTEHLPPTPCIVVCGQSPLSATAFMVAADQEVMMDNLKSFTDALVGMFMCFYIFNMHYPVELRATMEFLQR
ncbi:uncharacterized protein LOC144464683 [Epinephelus lanceolatus]